MAEAAATADHAGQRFDLIVIGGGVYGLTLAHEAAREGRAVLLLERDRLGGATSANSLRILHGGLRYLQTLNLSRALESIRERAFWLDTFPDLVRPLPCLMPLHGDGPRRPAVLRLALALNQRLCRLGDGGRLPRGRVIGPADVVRLCPDLAPAGLAGGALWWDAFAPDMARLLEALAGRARDAGAVLLERTPAIGFTRQNGRVAGVVATPSGGPDVVFRAATVVDAAGPWADRVLARAGIAAPEPWQPLLAWNLVLDRAAPAGEHALAVRARRPGAQTWFLVPAAEGLLAGTGYAPLDCVPDRPPGLAADLRKGFLDALNEAFPALALDERDVIAAPAGILPAAGPGRPWPAERTRIVDHARHGGPAGLVSVVGVKLTVARAAAARILRMTRRPG